MTTYKCDVCTKLDVKKGNVIGEGDGRFLMWTIHKFIIVDKLKGEIQDICLTCQEKISNLIYDLYIAGQKEKCHGKDK